MKAFINNLIPQIQKYSQNLDNLTFLTNHHWVSLNEIDFSKTVYIFRDNKILLISTNGIVSKGSWEYLGNESILFETTTQTLLLKHFFVDDEILMLKIDGSEGYILFVNETKYGKEINSASDVLNFLEKKYGKHKNDPSVKLSDFNDIVVPDYQEFEPIETFNVFFGNFDRIPIKFNDGFEGEINKGHSTDKYFYYDSVSGKRYAEDKLECINLLYKNLKHHISEGKAF